MINFYLLFRSHGYQDTSAIDATTCTGDITTNERIASTPHGMYIIVHSFTIHSNSDTCTCKCRFLVLYCCFTW